MGEFLKAADIILKATNSQSNFNFKTKLQVIEQTQKIAKNMKPYLIVTLRDSTNELRNVKKWIDNVNDLEAQSQKLAVGNILEIDGTYDGTYGPNIRKSTELKRDEINIHDFVNQPELDKGALIGVIFEVISNIKNELLKKFLEDIFKDENIKIKYIECPSSIKFHHSYKYGNLEHTVGMIKIFRQLVTHYNRNTNLDIDLIYTGIIVHDIGKLLEYELNNEIPRIIKGSDLHGHLILGTQLVSRYMNKIDNFPKDLKNRIRHMILSHHGKEEWDSIVKPQFPEAELLHYLDMIDSRFKLNY